MVVVVPPPPSLSSDSISVFHIIDELLSNTPILVFYGPSSTPTANGNNSRIQSHIFTPLGLQSYPRLTVSPSSPLYAAVNCLPREEQGDEICRGLAFSIFKYFSELPPVLKDALRNLSTTRDGLRSLPALFSGAHAAVLASGAVMAANPQDIIRDVRQALADQTVSWLDVDVILPPGSMHQVVTSGRDSLSPQPSDQDIAFQRFGKYASLVQSLGESSFLPTSRLKRAPSKPSSLNRSTTFRREQKEIIRREMCELLDTEESYVSKLYDLVYSVANEFREKAKHRGLGSASPPDEALKGLFPPCLDAILEINSAFLEDLRRVVEETENDAIADIESTTTEGSVQDYSANHQDATGSLSLALTLRTWCPKFTTSYVDYSKAHSQVSNVMRTYFANPSSTFSKRLQETTEQRLTSMLIEPVQRLPRYQLYIDNIVKQLPIGHPALKPLLTARDTVTEICSQNSSRQRPSQVVDHLIRIVPNWPLGLRPQGRLVTGTDVVDLVPPYRTKPLDPCSTNGVLLLFTDRLVFLKKSPESSMTARNLLAQIDGIDITNIAPSGLLFGQTMPLRSFHPTEMDSGNMLQLLPIQQPPKSIPLSDASPPSELSPTEQRAHIFLLCGLQAGKAARFLEDITKARIEGCYDEIERESHKWDIRVAAGTDISLLLAFSEGAHDRKHAEQGTAPEVRIVIDPQHQSCTKTPVTSSEPDVCATITPSGSVLFGLEIKAINGYGSHDRLTATELLPVLTKRIGNILQARSQITYLPTLPSLLAKNRHILSALTIMPISPEDQSFPQEQEAKPHSPVKKLTTLFGGAISRDGSFRRNNSSASSLLDHAPQLRPVPFFDSRPNSKEGDQSSLGPSMPTTPLDEAERLEMAVTSYILALQARKGNVVGKVLRNRNQANELAVNELYNALLEHPSECELAAQAPVDVLFAAFEKCISVAWRQRMGPVISLESCRRMQNNLENGYELDEVIQVVVAEMSPANRKAFRGIIHLLANLLDGSANDGDRGILTVSFAEVLASDQNPLELVSILDRLMVSLDVIMLEPSVSSVQTPHGSTSSRHGSTKGSTLSSASSLRKKFGFGSLSRKPKPSSDVDNSIAPVWRTLSKTKNTRDGDVKPLPRPAILARSNSTDNDARLSSKRPSSRERPSVLGNFSFEPPARPLSTIGEDIVNAPPRKKRRSSVSDMRSLYSATEDSTTPVHTPVSSSAADSQGLKDTLSTPTPSRPSMIPAPSPLSLRYATGSFRTAPASRQEIPPQRGLPRPSTYDKSNAATARPGHDEVVISTSGPANRRNESLAATHIPTLKSTTGLSTTSGNVRKLPPTVRTDTVAEAKSSPDKTVSSARLRMQSPQKLRERLAIKQQEIANAEDQLRNHLGSLGQALGAPIDTLDPPLRGVETNAQTQNMKGLYLAGATAAAAGECLDVREVQHGNADLTTKLANLNQTHGRLFQSLHARLDDLASDISTSLVVSEARSKRLDQLLRTSNAENEALYSRFNEELARVLGALRSDGGEGALREAQQKLAESQEECLGLRKENSRLKREAAGLRAQLRE